jgi:F-type H+/Na+-transporting ATPase subunit alpha
MSYDIVEKLKKEIEGFKDEAKFESVGFVVETGDGIARVSGLNNAKSMELLNIDTSTGSRSALAFNLEEQFIGVVILGDDTSVKVGDTVKGTGEVLSLATGDELLGRVVNPLGEAVDGQGTIFKHSGDAVRYFLERKAPGVLARESVDKPLHTGIKSIDAMIPIGRGQRELIIGDRGTGKTAIAMDTILNQKGENVVCIYVAIGQRNSKIARLVRTLDEHDALKYSIIVAAPASAPAALQYLAPFAGAAIAEYFLDQGRDALVVYDDLSKHADAYRELSLLLRRPPGREAYPGDVFYLHSRLLERAVKLNKENGGGSITALPIIETKLGDVSAYIPTNVISITDGQIYLESNLFNKGIRPAVNVGLSVSRVGSSAQTKAMKKVAGQLRLELAGFRELEAFVQFASDLDASTRAKIQKGQILTEMLKQVDVSPMSFNRIVIVLYAALGGYCDDLEIADLKRFEIEFLSYIEKQHKADILEVLERDKMMNDSIERVLKIAISDFKKIFK